MNLSSVNSIEPGDIINVGFPVLEDKIKAEVQIWPKSYGIQLLNELNTVIYEQDIIENIDIEYICILSLEQVDSLTRSLHYIDDKPFPEYIYKCKVLIDCNGIIKSAIALNREYYKRQYNLEIGELMNKYKNLI